MFVITLREDKAAHFWEHLDTIRKKILVFHANPCVPSQITLSLLFFIVCMTLCLLLLVNASESKMNAQRLLGEIRCRAWGELCSIVTLVLQERWKNQALVGWSVRNCFLEQIMALDPVPVYSYLLAPVTVAALGMHILIFTYCWRSLAELDKAVYPTELQGKLAQF